MSGLGEELVASFRGWELFEGLNEETYIPMVADMGPVFAEDSGWIFLDLAEGDWGEATGLGCYDEATYTRE
jgi:hypothetical protein